MAKFNTFKCFCGQVKDGANKWWLVSERPRESFTTLPWDDNLANDDRYEHVCSSECLQKKWGKWSAEAQ